VRHPNSGAVGAKYFWNLTLVGLIFMGWQYRDGYGRGSGFEFDGDFVRDVAMSRGL
jgi:hypothetical protein